MLAAGCWQNCQAADIWFKVLHDKYPEVTIQIKLTEIKGTFVALYNLQMAAALITLIVPLAFFLALSKYFIKGILAGAMKG